MKTSGILFRGKRTTDNEWIWGSLINDHSSGTVGIAIYAEMPKETMFFGGLKRCGIYQVNPETVGRFTGLTDKNGIKIYEGDIVRYGDTVHKVVFETRNDTAYFGLVYSPEETRPFGHYQDLHQIAVIGNIHDNPELLKI